MKVQLVSPRAVIGGNYGDGVYGPFGLLSLGTYIQKSLPEIDIEILDGALLGPQKELEDRVEGDLVGITANALNYGNVLRIAEVAKRRGAMVVVGGFHATSLAEEILMNRPTIDMVVKGEGEEALLSIIKKKSPEEIPNLVYRGEKGITTNPTREENISLGLDLNYRLLDLEGYFQNHGRTFSDFPERTMVFFTHMGCRWRELSGGCSFCSLTHKHQRLDPKELWRKIWRLKDDYGVQGIKDYGDDLVSDKKWLKEVARTRPKSLSDFVISGYASPKYLDREVAGLLDELNVLHILLGFESGNNQILRLANKGENVERNYRVAKMLDKKGVKILASYVLGLEGESEKTLDETCRFAERIAELDSTHLTQGGFIVPYPGSRLYQKLTEKMPEKYKGKDEFNVDEVRKDWVRHFCSFDCDFETAYKLIERTSRRLTGLSPLKTNYLGIKPE